MNGVDWYVKEVKLKWWQIPIFWWQCKFGKYRKHYVKFE